MTKSTKPQATPKPPVNGWHFLEPRDAWFFRDGRPYNEGESNQSDVQSEFPPNARTLAGALRAALARANGWKTGADWTCNGANNKELKEILGDGQDNLGKFALLGPFLTSDGKLLLPAPAHLASGKYENEEPQHLFLAPSSKAFLTDLPGAIALPKPYAVGQIEHLKTLAGQWITVDDLKTILAGKLPDKSSQPQKASALWCHETRVALKRNPDSHATEDGALYSPQYVRLRRGIRLACHLAGIPDGWKALPEAFPLGGESRMAVTVRQTDLPTTIPLFEKPRIESFADSDQLVKLLVYLATPMPLPADPEQPDLVKEPLPGEDLFGLTGLKLLSACCEKAVFLGGWDFKSRSPLPLHPHLPAGSVFFCETSKENLPAILSHHGTCCAPEAYQKQLGLGHLLFGHWPQTKAQPAK